MPTIDNNETDKMGTEIEVKTQEGIQPSPERTKVKRRERKSSRPRVVTSSEFIEKVVTINRVAKVTKGGKKLSFSALVVVGDGKGRVGFSIEKANEVADAIRKSLALAKKNMVAIPMRGSTIPHPVIGNWGAASVMLKPASEGTGVIAAGPVRAICDAAGIRNILTKCHKSNTPINVIRATMDGLNKLKKISLEEKEAIQPDTVATKDQDATP